MTAIITAAISMAQSIALTAKCYRGLATASNAAQLVAGNFTQVCASSFD
jgi:hypothetical protein